MLHNEYITYRILSRARLIFNENTIIERKFVIAEIIFQIFHPRHII